ncbi:carbonate dehydratase [Larsenimonas rhizosphaerae]|uniref:Carbonic anhydrase n=1 Tax=Larsenimonas rhizosphaerae TaxID=2944682 RepID=A0AA41ZEK8_9GAMM|nr:carbonate dehydratase [Larsenimonas rhizosphaerae]MCM2130688.1 carbonate dehydratase [Larsenimonas rhizosphaerae]MCX2523392.1 carbonate dehydratase [Larsenimonas rhizosphaerae]
MSKSTSPDIQKLLDQNKEWSKQMQEKDPDFFNRLSEQQNPHYLWIGCSDSRVPANQIIDLPPGEVFVHRNVANILHHTDMNAMSVIQYAVDVLKVEHIMVVGHYGCGGVRAALTGDECGIVDYWLHSIRQLHAIHRHELELLSPKAQADRMCELNVMAQVRNLSCTKIIQRAWARGQKLSVHGWCYSLKNGLVNNMECSRSGLDEVDQLYRFDFVSHS